MGTKVLLVARSYIIEPLGILHLAGLARTIGCEVNVELIPDNDFSGLYKKVEEWKPDFVGFSIWTGWHLQTFAACDIVRGMGPHVIIGGPHVTYF
ncbi:cobalamin B12-binding domain-containing protein, partial [Candidatus Parcubacteria bacterium]|nr:cobalamin B12-binding domain-containing protein [Candidatus Parcubacteria bacterium]